MNVLVVVDMQNDFIDGALGTKEAAAIVPKVVEKIQNFDGEILYTRDTHEENYLDTQEGKKLPVAHCIKGTKGWELHPKIEALRKEEPIDKPSFGSPHLGSLLRSMDDKYKSSAKGGIEAITFVGLCTDICVISNAMIAKAFLPEVPIIVDPSCCAGVTPESHKNALEAMKMCQIICEE
ncbi:cysteine hydrolase family protein [Sporofaciens musculi]|jgi:nicotinamidase-related amidase|uniref:cysteine hydrolase family protein n=1 Tax=Sporofaciens musculi TaxID=2681861 RepID=UPI0025705F38|nr:isochorismatase family cysteine hydrolase [Sporofaciens musculi]